MSLVDVIHNTPGVVTESDDDWVSLSMRCKPPQLEALAEHIGFTLGGAWHEPMFPNVIEQFWYLALFVRRRDFAPVATLLRCAGWDMSRGIEAYPPEHCAIEISPP